MMRTVLWWRSTTQSIGRSPGAELAAAGGVFLVANIPTVVLGGIWLHYKTRQDLREEMKRMDLQDLGRGRSQAISGGL